MESSFVIFGVLLGTAGALLSFVVQKPIIRRLIVHDVSSTPNHRTSHDTPTPRGGGIGPLCVFIGLGIALLAANGAITNTSWASPFRPTVTSQIFFLLGATSFGAVGFADDVKTLPATTRLAAQFIVASAVAVGITPATGVFDLPRPISIVISAGWIIFFVNAFNFMDGINGISIAEAVPVGIVVFVASHSALGLFGAILAGAMIGFAPYNYRNRGRARVFLGDSGSYGLGFIMAVLLLMASHRPGGFSNLWLFLVVVLPCVDVTFTLIRRALRRAPLFDAHREHLYQVATAPPTGLSHTTMSNIIFVVSLVLGLLGLSAR